MNAHKCSAMPDVLKCTPSEEKIEYLLQVPATLLFFDGHFPHNPVVPGYVLTGWAIAFARKHFKELVGGELAANALKFSSPVLPEQKLILTLTLFPTETDNRLKFGYIRIDESTTCCQGELRFPKSTSSLEMSAS